jgi:hypothetical protein
MSNRRSGFALLLLGILTACSTSRTIGGPAQDAAGLEAASAAGDGSGAGADSSAPPDLAPAMADAAPDAGPDATPDSEIDAAPDARQADAASVGIAPLGDGFSWHECEGSAGTVHICGKWAWLEAGNHFSADWSNGAHAFIDLVENGARVVLRRADPSGASTGLVADYVATANGSNGVSGTVTWSDKGYSWSGTWTATW